MILAWLSRRVTRFRVAVVLAIVAADAIVGPALIAWEVRTFREAVGW